MARLIIKDFGPIKDIDIELSRFTFFIGLQGCGKSTVAKVVSYCEWIEKEYSTTFSMDNFNSKEMFIERLMKFHKLNGYNKENTKIYYKSQYILIDYSSSYYKIELLNKFEYKRSKILYIPAERNIAIMPEIEKMSLEETSLRSFLFDWYDARKKYSKKQALEILNLGVRYFAEDRSDGRKNKLIHQNGNTFEIMLSDASSGLQSLVPLEVVIQYYSQDYFKEKENDVSFIYEEKRQKTYMAIMKELLLENDELSSEESIQKFTLWLQKLIANGEGSIEDDKIGKAMANLLFTHNTSFIIEEPEQNLYPSTQRDLLYFIFSCCNDNEKKHTCLITTHSPYLLNSITILAKAFQVKNNDNKELQDRLNEIIPLQSCVDISEIDIYEFSNGGAKKLSKIYGLPTDDNLLNNLLEKTNVDFADLLELEDLCNE